MVKNPINPPPHRKKRGIVFEKDTSQLEVSCEGQGRGGGSLTIRKNKEYIKN